jgi:hypothetical protein
MSLAPSFRCFIDGMFAAAAAAAAAAAESAELEIAAVVVSALISRKFLSMFSEEKYPRDMDINWNFMSSSVDWNIACDRFSCSFALCAVAVAAAADTAVAVSSSMPRSLSWSSSYFCSSRSSMRFRYQGYEQKVGVYFRAGPRSKQM